MKTLKRLAVTQLTSNSWEYSNGYDVATVVKNEDKSAELHNGNGVYYVDWPGGHEIIETDEAGLYRFIESKLMMPRSRKYTELEFERAVAAKGYIRGIVQLSLGSMDSGYDFGETLIRALVDTTEHGKKVKSYEFIGCEDHTVIVMVEVERLSYL